MARCLDPGCGTGAAISGLIALGSDVTNARVLVRTVWSWLERGQSAPVRARIFDARVSIRTHTDVDDFGAVLREAARLPRPGSTLVYIGAHPCLAARASTPPSVCLSAHRLRQWRTYDEGPAISPDGLRARVGAVHVLPGRLLSSFREARFELRSSRAREVRVPIRRRAAPPQAPVASGGSDPIAWNTTSMAGRRQAESPRKSRGGKRISPSRRQLRLLWLLAVVGVVAYLYYQPLTSYVETRRDLAARRAEVEALHVTKRELAQRLESWTSLDATRREARRIGYVLPGERLFVVKGIPDWRQARRNLRGDG